MRNRRIKVVSRFVFNAMHGIESMQVRQPSLVDEFYHSEHICPDTEGKVISYSHPLYMLFNQQRLNRLGPAAVESWLKSLETIGNQSLSELKSKCSDEDLLKLVKSRHIQSPSELEIWINDLNTRSELFNSEVAKIVAEQKQAMEQNTSTNVNDNVNDELTNKSE